MKTIYSMSADKPQDVIYGEPVFPEDVEHTDLLSGATITNVGIVKSRQIQGHAGSSKIEGGFALDVVKDGKSYRFILGYTELGEWTEAIVEL